MGKKKSKYDVSMLKKRIIQYEKARDEAKELSREYKRAVLTIREKQKEVNKLLEELKTTKLSMEKEAKAIIENS